ncbi:MAG TPA: TIGR04290 family methyltransferase, partial [Opitutus sp.]|nr:TIGR04290 family methyltransferase [Opitutus sp.]
MNPARFMTRTDQPLSGLAAEATRFEPWFHNVHLPDGSQTAPQHPLGDFPSFKWAQIADRLPADLTGWSALDIGCNSGFYSVELARRGAHVTALDKDPHVLKQAQWVIEQFQLTDRIELHQGQVYDLAHWRTNFDLILFMGVFYHLRYPLLALDIVASKTNRLLVFQTLTMPGDERAAPPDDLELDDRRQMLDAGWPKMAFIEKSLAGDPTNWWAPNHACIEAMLRTTGLGVLHHPAHEIYICQPTAAMPPELSGRDPEELMSATGGGGSVATT